MNTQGKSAENFLQSPLSREWRLVLDLFNLLHAWTIPRYQFLGIVEEIEKRAQAAQRKLKS